jgi:hypothetical protein
MADLIAQVTQDLLDSEEFVQDLVRGVHRSAMVFGPPGMGKTHLITAGLNRAGKVVGQDYLIARSHTTPMQFYAMLYMMRKPGQFVVMDDCDGLMRDEEGINLLKAATDNTFRTVGWSSTAQVKIPGLDIKVPKSFEFNGAVVIATNVRGAKSGRAAQHLAALKSRCVSWKMNYDRLEEQFAYVYHLIVDRNYLDQDPDTKLTAEQKVELLEFIQANLVNCTSLDLRKPQHIARVIRSKPGRWHNHARRFLETE